MRGDIRRRLGIWRWVKQHICFESLVKSLVILILVLVALGIILVLLNGLDIVTIDTDQISYVIGAIGSSVFIGTYLILSGLKRRR